MANKLLYQPPSSSFSPSFWEELYRLKLNVLKLDDSKQLLHGILRCSDGKHSESLQFDAQSHQHIASTAYPMSYEGVCINVNTIEEFKNIDKKILLNDMALHLLAAIISHEAFNSPSKLLTFILLTYSDLKVYRFTYWMAMPAIIPSEDNAFHSIQMKQLHESSFYNNTINGKQISTCLMNSILKYLSSIKTILPVIFVFQMEIEGNSIISSHILSLHDAWNNGILQQHMNCFIIFFDTNHSSTGFGWIVRNILMALSLMKIPSEVDMITKFIGLRGITPQYLLNAMNHSDEVTDETLDRIQSILTKHDVETDASVFAEVTVSTKHMNELREQICDALGEDISSLSMKSLTTGYIYEKLAAAMQSKQLEALKVVGWETNERGRPGPRMADLSRTLDSRFMMSQAVDLNLRLMKWRMWPTLDTEKLANTRCLLLGAGTLGCAVARSLLGWGVRHITFVDNGRVSYSNPARQCLFEFEDCEQRRYKCEAAAMHLKKIFPDVLSEGHILSIPMPGHPLPPSISGENATSEEERSFNLLDELVRTHDVCFTLTDSREARWLPTVMCAAYNKLLINAALGFDSYLVMHHGTSRADNVVNDSFAVNIDAKAGCYFCNDVVAATNSQKDRSMDQMCTVTRPGLSFIAAAQSVELLVHLLHSQSNNSNEEGHQAPPHQIRGSLAGFTQMLLKTPAFAHCTACSSPIINEYLKSKFEFMKKVCEDSSILEQLSGVQQMNDMVDLDLCIESDDEF